MSLIAYHFLHKQNSRVPWFRVAQALNVKFKSMTGRALTEDNLRFLAEKAFRYEFGGVDLTSLWLFHAAVNSSDHPINTCTYNTQLISLSHRTLPTQPPPQPQDMLTWSQFCKEPLPDRNFTFWEWFYAIMKLTREHLRGPWVSGNLLLEKF